MAKLAARQAITRPLSASKRVILKIIRNKLTERNKPIKSWRMNIASLPVSSQQDPLPKSARGEKIPNKKIIRDLGLKVTNQRLLILEIVRNGQSHFTAQDVFETVSNRNPDIGFATVYRFLRTLSEHSYVTEVRMGGMPARYEWAGKRHHDHLTCTNCAEIVEFENTEIERLQEKVAKQYGFQLTHHILELYGLCPVCRAKEVATSKR